MIKRMSVVLLLLLISAILLSGCTGIEERAWNAGQKALSEENYGEAAAAFEKAGAFQNAEHLLQYAKAAQSLENGDYTAAAEGFRALGDFKDSLLMEVYCRAEEQKKLAEAAFSSEDVEQALRSGKEASALFGKLTLFRDSDVQAAVCRDLLYTNATEWMNLGRYEEAASGFEALGEWQDCAVLCTYCRASALEQQSRCVEAAELFSEIPNVLDSAVRAETALGNAYQMAVDLRENGDYEAAADAFEVLGSYRDSEEQRNSSSSLLIRELLRSGAYAEVLKKLNDLSDSSLFPAADASADNVDTFLGSFIHVWMNAHAGVMNAYFSCNLLQPYLESGGELDTLIREEITDETAPQNYGFVFLGAAVGEKLVLDESFIAAKVRGTASWFGPEGPVETEETLQVLVDTSRGNPIAAAALPVT